MPLDGQVSARVVSHLCSFTVYLLSSYCVPSMDPENKEDKERAIHIPVG